MQKKNPACCSSVEMMPHILCRPVCLCHVICWEQAGGQGRRSLSSESQVHVNSIKTDRNPDRNSISGTSVCLGASHSECRVCENGAGAANVKGVMAVSSSTPAVKALLLSGSSLHCDDGSITLEEQDTNSVPVLNAIILRPSFFPS